MPFRHLDHTADLQLEVEAPTREELFAEALRGVTDCVTDVAGVRPEVERRLAASAAELDLLLVAWLDEALFHFERTGELFSAAAVELGDRAAGGFELRAAARGEALDPERHPVRTAIKGVTLHGLRVERHAGGWQARFVLDI